MKNWEFFEIECCEYLNKTYGSPHCEFKNEGGTNSNAPDVVFYKEGEKTFCIEVKMPSAQSGQFVLVPDFNCKQFVYSSRNKTKENEYSKEIVKVMNDYFDDFSMPTSGLIPINLDENLIYNWIQSHYQNDKGSEYFVTRRGKSEYIVFPVSSLKGYFEVSAGYRIKKSGSTNPNKSDIKNLKEKLGSGYNVLKKGKYTVVTSGTKINKNPVKCGSYDFLFKEIGPNEYLVTRLSNTRHANVIFSIKLKEGKTQEEKDLHKFIEALCK